MGRGGLANLRSAGLQRRRPLTHWTRGSSGAGGLRSEQGPRVRSGWRRRARSVQRTEYAGLVVVVDGRGGCGALPCGPRRHDVGSTAGGLQYEFRVRDLPSPAPVGARRCRARHHGGRNGGDPGRRGPRSVGPFRPRGLGVGPPDRARSARTGPDAGLGSRSVARRRARGGWRRGRSSSSPGRHPRVLFPRAAPSRPSPRRNAAGRGRPRRRAALSAGSRNPRSRSGRGRMDPQRPRDFSGSGRRGGRDLDPSPGPSYALDLGRVGRIRVVGGGARPFDRGRSRRDTFRPVWIRWRAIRRVDARRLDPRPGWPHPAHRQLPPLGPAGARASGGGSRGLQRRPPHRGRGTGREPGVSLRAFGADRPGRPRRAGRRSPLSSHRYTRGPVGRTVRGGQSPSASKRRISTRMASSSGKKSSS